jgi:hypothetical protein
MAVMGSRWNQWATTSAYGLKINVGVLLLSTALEKFILSIL